MRFSFLVNEVLTGLRRNVTMTIAMIRDDLAMPAGCNIKGKFAVRARVTGNLGIYHLQACRSYPGLGNPDHWFCSEEDAQAAGFRKAYNCRSPGKGK